LYVVSWYNMYHYDDDFVKNFSESQLTKHPHSAK